MTTITFNKNRITVKGHSGYAEYGKDIVCASISTLVESTYRYLIATNNEVEETEEDGFFEIKLKKINDSGKSIIKEFKAIVKDIEKDYFKFVRSENDERT